DDGIGNQIGGEHPGAVVIANSETTSNVGQSNIGDAGVEDFHEGCQRHHHPNQPGIVPGHPWGLFQGESLGSSTHRKYTLASTLMAGRSWRSRFSPGSSTIFTGMRWTIFT